MPPLNSATGGKYFVRIDGEEILCSGLTLEDLGVAEKELLAQREPINLLAETAAAVAGLDPETQATLYRAACMEARRAEYVDLSDVIRWIRLTSEGCSLALWLALERAKPGRFSRDFVREFVKSHREDASLVRAVDDMSDASGMSTEANLHLGNSQPDSATPQADSLAVNAATQNSAKRNAMRRAARAASKGSKQGEVGGEKAAVRKRATRSPITR